MFVCMNLQRNTNLISLWRNLADINLAKIDNLKTIKKKKKIKTFFQQPIDNFIG